MKKIVRLLGPAIMGGIFGWTLVDVYSGKAGVPEMIIFGVALVGTVVCLLYPFIDPDRA